MRRRQRRGHADVAAAERLGRAIHVGYLQQLSLNSENGSTWSGSSIYLLEWLHHFVVLMFHIRDGLE